MLFSNILIIFAEKLRYMTLVELEHRLEAIQESQMVTYSSLEKAGIGYMAAKRIQNDL